MDIIRVGSGSIIASNRRAKNNSTSSCIHKKIEAIEIEKAGLKVNLKKYTDFELIDELKENLELETTFNALILGRKRAYHLLFSRAKQYKTRISRIEKYKELILRGKGIHDCVCGLSKRMPSCDGSHKYIKR